VLVVCHVKKSKRVLNIKIFSYICSII